MCTCMCVLFCGLRFSHILMTVSVPCSASALSHAHTKMSCIHLVGMWLKECYYLYYCACTIGWCYTHLHVHPRSDRLLLQIFSYELWSYITFILLLVFSLWTLCIVRGQCCRKPNINRKVCQSEGLIAMCWHDCASVVSWTLTKSS